jgi:hypothetical protein
MPKVGILKKVVGALSVFNSAVEVASAVEGRRQPPPARLRELGIDPNAFAKINHF